MPEEVTRMTASVGSSIPGSGTSSTRTSRLPCQVTAFIGLPPRSYRTRASDEATTRAGRVRISVPAVSAAQQIERVGEGGGDRAARLVDAARAARKVADERPAPDARHAAGEHPVGRVVTGGVAHGLCDPGCLSLDYVASCLGRHVAGRDAGAAGGQDQVAALAIRPVAQ